MAKKKRPMTGIEYAKYLYMEARCTGVTSTMSDRAIVDARVRAFIDGARWAQRRLAKKRRAVGKSGEPR
jgi:hypothetical protein